jgi:hypothetical protein
MDGSMGINQCWAVLFTCTKNRWFSYIRTLSVPASTHINETGNLILGPVVGPVVVQKT